MAIDFSDIAMLAAERTAAEIWTSQTGKVVTRSGGFVDVQPVNRRWVDQSDGGFTYETLPIIPNLPISWPGPITWKVDPGSFGLIVHLSHSEAEFRRDGVADSEPGDLRRKHLGHAVFLPFFTGPDSAVSPSVDVDALVITATEIRLGSMSATNYAAMANLVKAELDKIAAAFSSFSPGSGGASFGAPYTTASPVASSKVKLDD